MKKSLHYKVASKLNEKGHAISFSIGGINAVLSTANFLTESSRSFGDYSYLCFIAGVASWMFFSGLKEYADVRIVRALRNYEKAAIELEKERISLSSRIREEDPLLAKIIEEIKLPASPYNNISKIIIEDKSGLESLLERTAKKEKGEWGTVFNASCKGKTAQVDKIIDPDYAMSEKIIFPTGRFSMGAYTGKLRSYAGTHHFHPSIRGVSFLIGRNANYAINLKDRIASHENLGLLSFNSEDGPELIGYNLFRTFIPESREDKSVLKAATYKDIVKYIDGN